MQQRRLVMAPTPTGGARKSALDRVGALEVLAALSLPRMGRVYDLGLETNERIPPGPTTPFSRAFRVTPEGTGVGGPYHYTAEVIHGNLHCGTHLDALIHVQAEGRVHGVGLASEARDDRGWTRNGMETVVPIMGRCLLLDVAKQKGVSALPDGYEVTADDLQAACRAAAVEVHMGDIVLVRTGKIRDFFANAPTYGAAEPGVGPAGAVWVYERGMAVPGPGPHDAPRHAGGARRPPGREPLPRRARRRRRGGGALRLPPPEDHRRHRRLGAPRGHRLSAPLRSDTDGDV